MCNMCLNHKEYSVCDYCGEVDAGHDPGYYGVVCTCAFNKRNHWDTGLFNPKEIQADSYYDEIKTDAYKEYFYSRKLDGKDNFDD